MQVWFYCSYSGSPVGFQLGTVNRKEAMQGRLRLETGSPPSLLRHCFSYQGLIGAYGIIPDSGTFLVVRNLKQMKKDDRNLTLNIAIETDDKAEYFKAKSFLYRKSPEELFAILSNIVIPDPGIAGFGISIDRDNLDRMIEQITSESSKTETESGFWVQARTGLENVIPEKLHLKDAPDGRKWKAVPSKGGLYSLVLRKQADKRPSVAVLAILAISIILVGVMCYLMLIS